jgi:hypothetical protein
VTSACVVPEKYRKEIDSKCFKFIWNNKPDKVERITVVGKLENGGLKMINIQSYFMSLTASWVFCSNFEVLLHKIQESV